MGTVTSYGVSATKLFQEIPDFLANGMIKGILKEDDIPATYLNITRTGFTAQADKFYNYGKNFFIYGLPGTDKLDNTDVTTAAKRILEAKHKTEILVRSSTYYNPSPRILALGAISEEPTLEFVVSDGSITVIAGRVQVSLKSYSHVGFNLNVVLQGVVDPNYQAVYNFPTTFAPNQVLYSITYTLKHDVTAEMAYWIYDPASGEYPELDITNAIPEGRNFYPIVPIRAAYGKRWVNEIDAVGDSSREILQKIGVDLESLIEGVQDPDDPSQLDDVEAMWVMFGMDVNSDEQIALKYCYEGFRSFYNEATFTQQQWVDNYALMPGVVRKTSSISIADANYKATINFNYMSMVTKSGTVDDAWVEPNQNVILPVVPQSSDNDGNGAVRKKIYISGAGTEPDGEGNFFNQHKLVYRKQITANTYNELVVHGLMHLSFTLGQGDLNLLRDVSDMADGGLYLPTNRDVVKGFSGTDESLIHYESLQLITYLVHRQDVPWYASSAFLTFVRIVAIAIAIITWNPEVAAEGWSWAAAMEIGTDLLIDAAIASLLMEALKVVIKLVSPEIAVILAAVVAAYAVYKGKTGELLKLLHVKDLMGAANLVFNAMNDVIRDDALKLMDDIEDFLASSEEKLEELTKFEEGLDTSLGLEAYDLLTNQPYNDFTETPTGFYNRTSVMANLAGATNGAISTWASDTLSLPHTPTDIKIFA